MYRKCVNICLKGHFYDNEKNLIVLYENETGTTTIHEEVYIITTNLKLLGDKIRDVEDSEWFNILNKMGEDITIKIFNRT